MPSGCVRPTTVMKSTLNLKDGSKQTRRIQTTGRCTDSEPKSKDNKEVPKGGHGIIIAINNRTMDGGHRIKKLTCAKNKVLTIAAKMKGTNTKVMFTAAYVNPKARKPSDTLQQILKKAKKRDSIFMGDINADYMKWKRDAHGNYEAEDRKTSAKAKRMKNMFEENKFRVCNDNGIPTSVVREKPSRVIDVIATNMKTERVTSEVTENWKPVERNDESKVREKAIRRGAKKTKCEHNRMFHRPVHTKMTWMVQRTREKNQNPD